VGFDIVHGNYGNIDMVSGQCKPCEGNRLLFISLERVKNKQFDKELFFHYLPAERAYKEENTVLDTNQPLSRENVVFVNEIMPISQCKPNNFLIFFMLKCKTCAKLYLIYYFLLILFRHPRRPFSSGY
jgi:hypothetical protein